MVALTGYLDESGVCRHGGGAANRSRDGES